MAGSTNASTPIAQMRLSGVSLANYVAGHLHAPISSRARSISIFPGDVLYTTVDEAEADWSYCGRPIIKARPYAEPKALNALVDAIRPFYVNNLRSPSGHNKQGAFCRPQGAKFDHQGDNRGDRSVRRPRSTSGWTGPSRYTPRS